MLCTSQRILKLVAASAAALILVLAALPAGAQPSVDGSRAPAQTRESVVAVQTVLADLGFYNLPIDGLLGPGTEAAIVAFHRAVGVEETNTWQLEDFALARNWTPPPDPDAPTRESVVAVQTVLSDLGFLVVPVDGEWGPATEAAILAFHKAAGVERTREWRFEDFELARNWTPAIPNRPSEPNRIEVDLTRQVLHLIENGERVATLGVASGIEGVFDTPQGTYVLERHIPGWRFAPLGNLYKPWYFWWGFAIHGSTSVPATTASHGCVRITLWDADWISQRLSIGMTIHVWDTQPADEPTVATVANEADTQTSRPVLSPPLANGRPY